MPPVVSPYSNIVGSVSGEGIPAPTVTPWSPTPEGTPAPVATPPNPNLTPGPSQVPPTYQPFFDPIFNPLPGGGGTSTPAGTRPPQPWDPDHPENLLPGDYRYRTGPGGRVIMETYSGGDILTEPGWVSTDAYFPPSGGAGSDPAYLAETVRSNMAREAEQRRRRALDAASNAANAFLTGSQLSDARRLNAFQESRSLLPFLVDPEQEFVSGQEPGGLVEQSLRRLGVSGFQPSRIQHKQLTPAQLAVPPSGEQVGSEITDYIGGIQEGGT